MTHDVAIVHDHLVQRGGAERVIVAMARAFPEAPIYTSVYEPRLTYPELALSDVRPLGVNGIPGARGHHRLILPLLPAAFSALHVDARVTICSSAGWAHGARTTGSKLIYWHSPNRWIHSIDTAFQGERRWLRSGAKALRRPLAAWDERAVSTADAHLANSTAVARSVESLYSTRATVLHPPSMLAAGGRRLAIEGIRPGFFLLVSRLQPYKNVVQAVDAFRLVPHERLLVIGTGSAAEALRRTLPPNVHLVGRVDDAELRWAYHAAQALIAPAYEDFGLTPIEANAFGKPVVALRAGGYVDTVIDAETGTFFDVPEPRAIADAISRATATSWNPATLVGNARRFGFEQFVDQLRDAVDQLRFTAALTH